MRFMAVDTMIQLVLIKVCFCMYKSLLSGVCP